MPCMHGSRHRWLKAPMRPPCDVHVWACDARLRLAAPNRLAMGRVMDMDGVMAWLAWHGMAAWLARHDYSPSVGSCTPSEACFRGPARDQGMNGRGWGEVGVGGGGTEKKGRLVGSLAISRELETGRFRRSPQRFKAPQCSATHRVTHCLFIFRPRGSEPATRPTGSARVQAGQWEYCSWPLGPASARELLAALFGAGSPASGARTGDQRCHTAGSPLLSSSPRAPVPLTKGSSSHPRCDFATQCHCVPLCAHPHFLLSPAHFNSWHEPTAHNPGGKGAGMHHSVSTTTPRHTPNLAHVRPRCPPPP